jgi:gas vesicle protein
MIDKKVGGGSWERFQFPWSNVGDDYDWDTESFSWYNHQGEELQMQESGLYTLDGKSTNGGRNYKRTIFRRNGRKIDITVDDDENNNDDNTNGYRYDQTQKTIDSLKKINDVQKQKLKDSLNKVREQINKKIEKLEDKAPTQEAYLPLSDAKYDFVLHI